MTNMSKLLGVSAMGIASLSLLQGTSQCDEQKQDYGESIKANVPDSVWDRVENAQRAYPAHDEAYNAHLNQQGLGEKQRNALRCDTAKWLVREVYDACGIDAQNPPSKPGPDHIMCINQPNVVEQITILYEESGYCYKNLPNGYKIGLIVGFWEFFWGGMQGLQ